MRSIDAAHLRGPVRVHVATTHAAVDVWIAIGHWVWDSLVALHCDRLVRVRCPASAAPLEIMASREGKQFMRIAHRLPALTAYALPEAEKLVDQVGFEPTTSCLQGRRSPK